MDKKHVGLHKINHDSFSVRTLCILDTMTVVIHYDPLQDKIINYFVSVPVDIYKSLQHPTSDGLF